MARRTHRSCWQGTHLSLEVGLSLVSLHLLTFRAIRRRIRRMVKVTYYLEVISSWCFWAEPTWAELKRRYEGRVEFGWKIAQMPADAYPVSKSQCEWFYRRSGSIVRSP